MTTQTLAGIRTRPIGDCYDRRRGGCVVRSLLKIHAGSLICESKCIRLEQQKLKSRGQGGSETYQRLQRHRVVDLRNEIRAAQLLSAFVRHIPYRRVERNGHDPNDSRWRDVQLRLRVKCVMFGLTGWDVGQWLAARTTAFVIATILLVSSASAQCNQWTCPAMQPNIQVMQVEGWQPTGYLGILRPRYVWTSRPVILYDPDRTTISELQGARAAWASPATPYRW